MDVASTLKGVRQRAGLTLRELAERAQTSHSALAAYESGAKSPNATTLARIIDAAGFAADIRLRPRQRGTASLRRGDELVAVLTLAAEFPARHTKTLEAPVFPQLT